jgi:Glycosyl transferase family 2
MMRSRDVVERRLAQVGYAPARVVRPHPNRLVPRPPRVSVVVPCYNYGHFLPSCVDSVLDQAGVEVEVLVIDDASPDGSAAVARAVAARDSRVRAICHEINKGHIATYNEGLALIDGEFVVLLSADDLLAPGALRRATELMAAYPTVGLAYGFAVDFQDAPPAARVAPATWTIWRGRDWIADRCRTGRNALRSPEAVLRTTVLREVGGYRPDLPHAADFEMWMKAASISDVGYVGGCDQAYYRVHAANMHSTAFSVDDPKGVIVDLRQRLTCFESVLDEAPRVAGAAALLRRARRALARDALTMAVRCYEWGTADRWPVDVLADFAAEVCPSDELPGLWRALALRRRVGPARSRRHPLFLPGEQVYKVRDRLDRWRWRRAGL